MSAKDTFQLLVQKLKLCPTSDTSISPKLLHEVWAGFRRIDPEHGDEVTSAMLVALILHDRESFAGLLTAQQLDQLHRIAGQVMHNYELAIQPSNQIGRLLAATIKENEKI